MSIQLISYRAQAQIWGFTKQWGYNQYYFKIISDYNTLVCWFLLKRQKSAAPTDGFVKKLHETDPLMRQLFTGGFRRHQSAAAFPWTITVSTQFTLRAQSLLTKRSRSRGRGCQGWTPAGARGVREGAREETRRRRGGDEEQEVKLSFPRFHSPHLLLLPLSLLQASLPPSLPPSALSLIRPQFR